MASKLVVDAVEARLTANWTATAVIGLNTQEQVPAGQTPFLTVQYPVSNEEHNSLGQVGQRTFRESGGIRFVLSISRGSGVSQGLTWIETLRTLFRAAQFGGINCEAVSPPVLDDNNSDGKYFRLSCVASYWADILA